MSVNISVDLLKPGRVGRPETLVQKDIQNHFPLLTEQNGWKYFKVTKATKPTEKPEVHCLRVSSRDSHDHVNDMEWYCPGCSTFPCKWRGRARHLKTCNQSCFVNNGNNSTTTTNNNSNDNNALEQISNEDDFIFDFAKEFASLAVTQLDYDNQSIEDFLALLNLESNAD